MFDKIIQATCQAIVFFALCIWLLAVAMTLTGCDDSPKTKFSEEGAKVERIIQVNRHRNDEDYVLDRVTTKDGTFYVLVGTTGKGTIIQVEPPVEAR